MQITDAVIKGILAGMFMAISVGPTLFAIIKYSLNYSYKAGLAFVLGVSISDIMYVGLANIAASWLLSLKPYEKYIGFGGALALMVIGLSGIFRKQKIKRPSSGPMLISGKDYFKIWLSGFLVNTLNPGVMITWLGAVTLTANAPSYYRFVLFVTCLVVILSIDFFKIFLADKIKSFLTLRKIVYVQRFSSACIFFIGVMLFVSTLTNARSENTNKDNKIDKIISK